MAEPKLKARITWRSFIETRPENRQPMSGQIEFARHDRPARSKLPLAKVCEDTVTTVAGDIALSKDTPPCPSS